MGQTLNRHSLTEAIAKNCLLTSSKSEEVLRVVFAEIESALLLGKSVKFSGLGSFTIKTKKPRYARNFATGEAINVPEQKTISFAPSDKVLNKLNGRSKEDWIKPLSLDKEGWFLLRY